MSNTIIVILAGGTGKRMQSDLPKVLHIIDNEPMIVKIVKQSILFNPMKICIVVGIHKDAIQETLAKYVDITNIEFIIQNNPKGTGHAMMCAIPSIESYLTSKVLILYGDTPFINCETMQLINQSKHRVTITTMYKKNPSGSGRIIDINNQFLHIVEEKDCTLEQRTIQRVNCGTYSIESALLCKYLPQLDNNNMQGEYYLTDIISLIKISENIEINMITIPPHKQHLLMGVNSKEELKILEKYINE
tara:strand:+ start:1564 stop:2304 length:741 start_codon:yes stop_codon:yes gene_type:complete